MTDRDKLAWALGVAVAGLIELSARQLPKPWDNVYVRALEILLYHQNHMFPTRREMGVKGSTRAVAAHSWDEDEIEALRGRVAELEARLAREEGEDGDG